MSYHPRKIAVVETKIRLKTKIRLEIRSGTWFRWQDPLDPHMDGTHVLNGVHERKEFLFERLTSLEAHQGSGQQFSHWPEEAR